MALVSWTESTKKLNNIIQTREHTGVCVCVCMCVHMRFIFCMNSSPTYDHNSTQLNE